MIEALLANKPATAGTELVDAVLAEVIVNSAIGVYMDSTIISVGGAARSGGINGLVRAYTNTSKQMTEVTTTGTIPAATQQALSVMLGSLLYVVGGSDSSTSFRQLNWETKVWTTLASPPRALYGCSLIHLDGFLYTAGATVAAGNTTFLRYEIATNTWASLGITPFKIINGRMVEASGKLYMLGGYDYVANTRNGKCYVYNMATSAWVAIAPLPLPLSEMAVVSYDGKIYVTGGADNAGKRYNRMLIYDIAQNTWVNSSKFGPMCNGAQMVLMNKTIYQWGGTEAPYIGESLNMYKYVL